MIEIHPPCRLSSSAIWKLQSDYYRQRGPAAWTEISSQSTCNAFNAAATARLITKFFEDVMAGASAPAPRKFCIIELGALTGQFGFLVARNLDRWMQGPRRRRIAGEFDFTYVMTDVAEENVRAWSGRERLRPLIEKGRLELAEFDCTDPESARSVETGQDVLGKYAGCPCIVIANYVMHILPVDAFRVSDGALSEILVGLSSSAQEMPRTLAPDIFSSLATTPVPAALSFPCYGDPLFDEILVGSAAPLRDTVLMYPVGALRMIARFLRLSAGQMMLLATDIAVLEDSQIDGRSNFPESLVSQPCGKYTASANINVLRRFLERQGGRLMSRQPAYRGMDLYVFLAGDAAAPGSLTEETASRLIEGFSPASYDSVMKGLREIGGLLDLDAILALLELGSCDIHLFERLSARLQECVRGQTSRASSYRIEKILAKVWDNRFRDEGASQLAFTLGQVCRHAGRIDAAIGFYLNSIELGGDDHIVRFNLGKCEARRGDHKAARNAYLSSDRLAPPGWDYASDALARLEAAGRSSA